MVCTHQHTSLTFLANQQLQTQHAFGPLYFLTFFFLFSFLAALTMEEYLRSTLVNNNQANQANQAAQAAPGAAPPHNPYEQVLERLREDYSFNIGVNPGTGTKFRRASRHLPNKDTRCRRQHNDIRSLPKWYRHPYATRLGQAMTVTTRPHPIPAGGTNITAIDCVSASSRATQFVVEDYRSPYRDQTVRTVQVGGNVNVPAHVLAQGSAAEWNYRMEKARIIRIGEMLENNNITIGEYRAWCNRNGKRPRA